MPPSLQILAANSAKFNPLAFFLPSSSSESVTRHCPLHNSSGTKTPPPSHLVRFLPPRQWPNTAEASMLGGGAIYRYITPRLAPPSWSGHRIPTIGTDGVFLAFPRSAAFRARWPWTLARLARSVPGSFFARSSAASSFLGKLPIFKF